MRYPVVLTGPDGRRIRCLDGEHAAAVHLLTDWLVWDRVAGFVSDHGEVGWTGVDAHAWLHASSERLLVQAAQDLYCGPRRTSPAGLKLLCHGLDAEHLVRVLEAVCLLRPDAAPPVGWSR